MIPFNSPPLIGTETDYIKQAFVNKIISGDGPFTKKCNLWLKNRTQSSETLLTTSCTHALEMSALLCGIKEGDEVIMPSFTFVSTANAFALRGAKIIFIDIRKDTMNMDENLIEEAVTKRTKIIVPVHYAGVSCEMDEIIKIAIKYNLFVVEDAAQGLMSTYKNKPLGSMGDLGCFSFHETKNYSMGEGGALNINRDDFIEEAEIIREKGTDRTKFHKNMVDKYSWVSIGSSYLPSEINAAYLFSQLEKADEINAKRHLLWKTYNEGLLPLQEKGIIELPFIPDNCTHNAHIYYIKIKNESERSKLILFLKESGISAVFHYVPLHSSKAGLKYGEFRGEDKYTTVESLRLLRLPLYYNLSINDVEFVIKKIAEFYDK